MRCSLCDKDRALYPLVYRSDEMKVANALQGVTPLRACESCWMAETAKMPQYDMLDVLLGALIDAETAEEKLKELDEEHDKLKSDFEDLEKDSADKIDEDDHTKAVEEAHAEGLKEGKQDGWNEGYDEGHEDVVTQHEQAAEASERRAAVEELP